MAEASRYDFGHSRDLTIAEIARLHGVSLRALRFYEQKQLLTPRRIDGRRFYRADDEIRLAVIIKAKKMGFTLAEIARLLDRGQPDADDGGHISLSQRQIEDQLNVLLGRRREIETAIAELQVALGTMDDPGVGSAT